MRRARLWLAIAVGAALGVCGWYWLRPGEAPPPTLPSPAAKPLAAAAQPVPPPPAAAEPPAATPRATGSAPNFSTAAAERARRAREPLAPAPLTPVPAARTPETEVARVRLILRDYRAAFGSNPTGSNPEITRALLGANPTKTRFVDPSSVTVNERGELLDVFGHPYFFHALSGTRMEIRSAGQDGRLFTEDDIVK